MAEIHTRVDRSRGMTVNTVEGILSLEDIVAAVERYLSHKPTPRVLWDLRRADGSALRAADLIRLQDVVRRLAPENTRRRIALVVTRDLGFGLSRMAESQGRLAGISAGYYVTRSMPDALTWLGIPSGHASSERD